MNAITNEQEKITVKLSPHDWLRMMIRAVGNELIATGEFSNAYHEKGEYFYSHDVFFPRVFLNFERVLDSFSDEQEFVHFWILLNDSLGNDVEVSCVCSKTKLLYWKVVDLDADYKHYAGRTDERKTACS